VTQQTNNKPSVIFTIILGKLYAHVYFAVVNLYKVWNTFLYVEIDL